jgi:hypothetical protein
LIGERILHKIILQEPQQQLIGKDAHIEAG